MMFFCIELLLLMNIIFLFFPVSISLKRNFAIVVSLFLSALFFLLIIFMPSDFRFLLNVSDYLPTSPNFGFFFDRFSILFSIDNTSLLFLFLTSFLIFVCYLSNIKNPQFQNTLFLFLLAVLHFSLINTFSSTNILFFFVFFEFTLIPMFLLILFWGSRQRKLHAAFLFFFFTVLGSALLLVGILYLYKLCDTFQIYAISLIHLDYKYQLILCSLFFLGFAVKIPVVPFHIWLPEAHVEAPTSGSIILAGLLLKIGTFGMLRFMLPHLNEAILTFRPLIFTLALISIYYASFMALTQVDLKKIIAYSSISHMGFVLLGLFSLNYYGIIGSIYIMFSHGLVSSALFYIIGTLYDRYKTKNILEYGGLASTMPLFSVFFFLLTLANISFPLTSNFSAEIITLLGVTEVNYFVSGLATFSMIFTLIYSVWAYNRMCFGNFPLNLQGFSDLNKLEFYILFFFTFLILLFGIYSTSITHLLELKSFSYLITL